MLVSKQCEWAFSLNEYRQMFDLHDVDLRSKILDFPGSMSSFNAEVTAMGGHVVSGEQTYDLSAEAQSCHVEQQLHALACHLDEYADKLADKYHRVSDIMAQAQQASAAFLKDYPQGCADGRYQAMTMPALPFEDYHFDLALCSHWLFSESPDSYFQLQMIKELIRVAGEVRIYPLLDRYAEQAASLGPVMVSLQQENFGVELREVDFELKKQGNALLRVWARECRV